MSEYFLLEDGVDLTLGTGLAEVLDTIEEHTSTFSHQGFIFHLCPVRGELRKSWTLEIAVTEVGNPTSPQVMVGTVSIELQGDHDVTCLQVLPWHQQSSSVQEHFDIAAQLFTTYLIELFRVCQRKGFIDIPAFG